jgi:capsid protein
MKKLVVAAFLSVVAVTAAAQTISTESTNTNNNTSTNTNTNTNINHTTGEMTNRNITESTQTLKQPPPTAVAPAVTTINNDVCAIVASGAVQTQIFGISMGGTMRDMNCERIKLSKNLFDMGMKVAAVATLCQDERVFAAMMAAGTPCPVDGKIGAQAREEWDRRGIKVETDKVGAYAVPSPKEPVRAQPTAAAAPVVLEGCGDYTGDDPIVQRRVCGR